MLVFLFTSMTVLGECQKNRKVQLSILSSCYNQATFYPPAIFMANSTISTDDDCKGEKLTGLLVAIVIKDKVLSEGAKFRVIKTSSIKESANTEFNVKRGPQKKVLKKPI